MEDHLDDAVLVAAHPVAARERRIDAGQALALGLVAGEAGHFVNALTGGRDLLWRADELAQVIPVRRAAELELVRCQGRSPLRLRRASALAQGVVNELVRGQVERLGHDFRRDGLAEVAGGDDGFQTHAGVLVLHALGQEFRGVGQLLRPHASDARSVGADARVLGGKQLGEQGRARDFVRLIDADDFEEQVLVTGRRGRELGHPVIGGFQHVGGGHVEEEALGLVARPALGRLELFEEFSGLHRGEVGLLHGRTAFRGDAPDAAVGLVATRVGVAGLVVADDGIEPVREIHRAVRADAHVHGTERGVR